ncbi:MAG: MSMEG_6728 family protein [Candidatus Thorarchaeota archaeon]
MQTFITDHDMAISAKNLDNKRLGKQRVEALQIFECLIIKETKWKNHPAVKMWKGYEGYLLLIYLRSILNEWGIIRNFKSFKCEEKWFTYMTRYTKRKPYIVIKPSWITDEFIESHRSNLIRKKPEYYNPLFPNTKEGL